MRAGWIIGAVAAVAFVAFLVATAPASLVAARIGAVDPALTLDAVRGNAWHGRARARYREVDLGSVEWMLSPLALFAGRAALAYRIDGPAGRLDGRARRALFGATLRIDDASGNVPLATLSQLTGARGPLDGVVELDRVSFALDGADVTSATGTVRFRDAAALLPHAYPLGSYTLALSADDGWLLADVVGSEGPLVIAGNVRIRGNGHWRLDARVRTDATSSELGQVLQLLGEPDADGYRPLRLEGSL